MSEDKDENEFCPYCPDYRDCSLTGYNDSRCIKTFVWGEKKR